MFKLLTELLCFAEPLKLHWSQKSYKKQEALSGPLGSLISIL